MTEDNNGTVTPTEKQGSPVDKEQLTLHNQSPIRVLNVDDTPHIVEMNRRQLEQCDDRIEVESEQSAAEGMQRLADETFDCIISDYWMAGMNGVEFLKTVREEWLTLPFIFYTSNQSEAAVTDALSAGATDYIQKQGGTAHLKILGRKIINAVEARRISQTHGKLLTAAEATGVGIGVLNQQEQIIYANNTLADYLEMDTEEIKGEDLERINQKLSSAPQKRPLTPNNTDNRTTSPPSDGLEMDRTYVLVNTAKHSVNTVSSITRQSRRKRGDDDDT